MSITLTLSEALGLIAKLVPQLKSLTGARRREYFERLIAPLFESLGKVHTTYDTLFLTTREAVVALRVEPQTSEGTTGGTDQLAAIVENFRRLRQTDESLRDTVRRNAQDSLTAMHWAEEKRFYLAVSHYFLRAWPTPTRDESLDGEALSLIKTGGRDVWPTPSSLLYAQLQRASEPTQVVELLDSARTDLIDRWTQVSARYRAVVAALVMET